MGVTSTQVLEFLGRPDDTALAGSAQQAIPVVTTMARAYTRGKGFDTFGEPEDDMDAVILSAAARLASNPSQIASDETAGPFTRSLRGSFNGWTIAELSVLNRYRDRAQ